MKTHRHDRSSGLVDNISDAVAIVRMNGCYLKHSTAREHTQLCATHKFRRNRYEFRIFRYISSEKIRLKLSQLKERHHDGHDVRI
ncbi:hypothetical protein AGR1B_Lc10049 [Agrobacterium fabacearum S56]|nr:hypothetical protein AGR1B_Lc10049 [Agrobacterium fabacearum S56]